VESRWRRAWEEAGCFRAPDRPCGEKYFNYDSGPFPNGPLHMGHVRTYVLGDVTARYQRLLGKSVLYCTEFDSFGLPNEMAAVTSGADSGAFTARCIDLMTEQLKVLGISYDWERVPTTSHPAYYRWTQWLFLKLFRLGLVDRRETDLNWCDHCQTTLARIQCEGGCCWRCKQPTTTRRMRQWFIKLSAHSHHLREGLEDLDGWSAPAKQLLGSFIGRGLPKTETGGYRVHDWLVSRQRCWGTPIPMVHCSRCEAVPVPEEDLPVLLPEGIDWSLGPKALAARDEFVNVPCPECGLAARRETDTLDCYFDDIWCFLGCLVPLDRFSFSRQDLEGWMPVDRFHSGLDTFFYLHLHRFLGAVLQEQGILEHREPLRSYLGHEMVLFGGRKMSKHLGNAVSPKAALRKHGADALRVGILWAASPQRRLVWDREVPARAVAFLEDAWRLYRRCAEAVVKAAEESPGAPGETGEGNMLREGISRPDGVSCGEGASRAARALGAAADATIERVGTYIDEYRPNAAIQELFLLLRRIERFAIPRIESRRLSDADGRELHRVLLDHIVALSPFAPHLAEEIWRHLGQESFVCLASWPSEGNL
jgi:leucyl-tRNA synthetase